jgi:hypothetical protein
MDLQLTSLVADQTRRYPITGLRINGHARDVVLLVRWTQSSEAYERALDAAAFQKLDRNSDAWRDALVQLIAEHLVVGWDHVPEGLAYTPARGAQVIGAFHRDNRPDRWLHFLAFIAEGDNFVDAGDLGNG